MCIHTDEDFFGMEKKRSCEGNSLNLKHSFCESCGFEKTEIVCETCGDCKYENLFGCESCEIKTNCERYLYETR